MRKSSAYKIPYDIRPSKQTERRVLLDILRTATESGFDLRRYKYIGFGGFRFYDFEMLYRHLGIRDMTSIELDTTLSARCKFNKPFGFIDFREDFLGDYLDRTNFRKPIVAWLDYDCRLADTVVKDLRMMCTKAPVGSFIFVTVDARLPEGLETLSPQERFAAIKHEYGEMALADGPDDLSEEEFPQFVERVIWSVMSESLSRRSDGIFVPLVRVFYKDSALMVTVGVCHSKPDLANEFRKRLKSDFRFLIPSGTARPFTIPAFNLTARERRLFDSAVTGKSGKSTLGGNLRRLGFTKREIDDYKKMQRFIPSYFESYF